jgi:hypothetical protein
MPMTNVAELESLIVEGWQIPLALFIVLSELLPKHPAIGVNVDEYRGGEEPILDVFVDRHRDHDIAALHAALDDFPGVYLSNFDDHQLENVYFEFEIEKRR